jgi:hypothetical protein
VQSKPGAARAPASTDRGIDKARELVGKLSEWERRYAVWRAGGGKVGDLKEFELSAELYGLRGRYPTGSFGRQRGFWVIQIIDRKTVLASLSGLGRGQGPVWIDGLDTSEAIDDGYIESRDCIFAIAGTKTYRTTTGGSRTIRRMVVVNTPAVDAVLANKEARALLGATGK